MVEGHARRLSNTDRAPRLVRPTTSEVMSAYKNWSDRHDTFLWPLSWLYQGIHRVCVPRWKPCCVVIMHSSHKLTPQVHIIHQRRLEAWVSWFLMILVISSNLSWVWLLPPTRTCGPWRKIRLEMLSWRVRWLA
jgi:hypothetical protein